jgi:SET family sugar efflux transporter-like MFS transporter
VVETPHDIPVPGATALPDQFPPASRLSLVRDAAPLAGTIGLYGVTSAFLSTTTSLFLADAVRVGPLLIGLFFTWRGVVAVATNQPAGRLSDRLPDRRLLIAVAGVAGALGALGLAVLRNYVAVLVTETVFLSISGLGFTQMFAYANELAQAHGRPVTAFMAWIRSVFSAAWVIGPPAGLFLLTRFGFGPLYLVTGGLSLGCAALGYWGLRRMPPPPRTAKATGATDTGRGRTGRGLRALALALPRRTWLLVGAVVALGVVNQMYAIDIALYITKDLHLGAQLVGWIAGVSAALEIPIMILVGRVADRLGKRRILVAATVAATAFFCLMPLARSAAPLLALQVLNAAWVAVAMSIPMVMLQEEGPGGAGSSSALYSSAFMSASLLAGAITGVTAAAVGFGGVFWVCAALSAVAGGLLLASSGSSGSVLRPDPGDM